MAEQPTPNPRGSCWGIQPREQWWCEGPWQLGPPRPKRPVPPTDTPASVRRTATGAFLGGTALWGHPPLDPLRGQVGWGLSQATPLPGSSPPPQHPSLHPSSRVQSQAVPQGWTSGAWSVQSAFLPCGGQSCGHHLRQPAAEVPRGGVAPARRHRPAWQGVPTQDVTHTPCSLVPEACRAGGRRPEVRAAEPSTQSWPGARAEWLTPGQSAPETRPPGASAAHTPTVPPSHTGPPGGDVRGGGLAAGPAGPLLLFPQAHPTAAQQPERRDARDRVSAPAASPRQPARSSAAALAFRTSLAGAAVPSAAGSAAEARPVPARPPVLGGCGPEASLWRLKYNFAFLTLGAWKPVSRATGPPAPRGSPPHPRLCPQVHGCWALGEGRPAVAAGERGRPQGQARLRPAASRPPPRSR